MKKLIFSLFVIGFVGSNGLVNVAYAAEFQPTGVNPTNSDKDNAVSGLGNSDLIVVMEDGAIVHGEVEINNLLDPNDKVLVNSELDPKAVTVDDYKENPSSVEKKELPKQSINLARSATPPGYSIKLKNRASYSSAAFSARGWRFAERFYYPESGTGAFLRWETFRDSGVVGGILAARNTYKYGKNGNYYGQVIYPGGYSYIEGLTTYYTYNPIPNTWFRVSNF